MPKHSIINRNAYPDSFVAWCQTLDKEAVRHAILEGCSTQIQFRTSDHADGSGYASAQESGGLLEEGKTP